MLWIALIAAIAVVVIYLEGRRQSKVYGPASGRSAMRSGMLELQRHLEPERNVEVLLEEREETEQDEAGEPPEAGLR